MDLIPVSKGGDYLEVHPVTLPEHKRLGWEECEKRQPEQPKPKGKAKADKSEQPEPEQPKE